MRLKGRPWHTWEEGIQKILKERGIERNGVQVIAGDRERWKALCKPSTFTGRRNLTN